jgi:hypothetical protein
MSDQLSLFAPVVSAPPNTAACWCVESDLWGGGRFCAAAKEFEANSPPGTIDHTNALRVVAYGGSVCDSCGKQHFDGAWLICDDCDVSLLRAWLKWSVDIKTAIRLVGALVARSLWGVA